MSDLPPIAAADFQAEKDLVGRVLALKAMHPDAKRITPSMFSDRGLRLLWELMLETDAKGDSLDWREFQHVVARQISYDYSEEVRALRRLYVVGKSAGEYARRVQDAWARRQLQELGLVLENLPRDKSRSVPDLVAEVVRTAEGVLVGAELQDASPESVIERAHAYFEGAALRRELGQSLTFGLDGALDGLVRELWAGELTVVGARPSCGKTAFSLNVARHAMQAGRRVLFVSLETREERLVCNLLAQVTGVPMRELELCSMEQWAYAEQCLKALPGLLQIVDRGVRTAADVDEVVVRTKPDLVVIDYLQLLRPARKDASRYETVTESSVALKRMAVRRGVHVIALAQLSRANTQRADKHPTVADLRESGQIEQDADVILLLHREAQYDKTADPESLEVYVAKNRNGAAGEGILTRFNRQINRIERAPWRPPTPKARGGHQ